MNRQYLDFGRIFMISDIHMGVRANSLEWLDNQVDYFRNFFIPLIKEHYQNGDMLFILGDLFDNRQSIDILVSNTTEDLIDEISEIIPVHILCGNHDMYKRVDNNINSLNKFKYFNNVTVHTEPTIIENSSKKSIILLPYSEDYDIDVKIIEDSGCDYLFAHADILGMKLDNGSDVKKGLNLSTSNIKKVYSGHIHKRQEKNKFVYIGSPYHTKRGDIGDRKGIYLFNPETNTHTLFHNDYSPIFNRLNLNQLLSMSLESVKNLLKNNYTDIVVPLELVNVFNISTFINAVEGCGYKRIEAVVERQHNVVSENISVSINETNKSLLELLNDAIDNIIEDEADRVIIKDINNKYYNTSNLEY